MTYPSFSTRRLGAVLAAGLMLPALALAGPTAKIAIRNQAFDPDTLTIPAHQRVQVTVSNEDTMPAEFESYDAGFEQVIPGKTSLPVQVGPLDPGTYQFFNEFHPNSKGKLIVKPAE